MTARLQTVTVEPTKMAENDGLAAGSSGQAEKKWPKMMVRPISHPQKRPNLGTGRAETALHPQNKAFLGMRCVVSGGAGPGRGRQGRGGNYRTRNSVLKPDKSNTMRTGGVVLTTVSLPPVGMMDWARARITRRPLDEM